MNRPHELLRQADALLHEVSRIWRRTLRRGTASPSADVSHLLRCAQLTAQVELLATALAELVEEAALVDSAGQHGIVVGEPHSICNQRPVGRALE